jgi:hypothetical protein
MAKVYYNLIKNENIDFTIDYVPERWKAAVQKLLDEDKDNSI